MLMPVGIAYSAKDLSDKRRWRKVQKLYHELFNKWNIVISTVAMKIAENTSKIFNLSYTF